MFDIVTSLSLIFRSLGGLKMFAERNTGKGTLHVGIAVTLRLCCPAFHFTSFNFTFGKNYLNSKLQVIYR